MDTILMILAVAVILGVSAVVLKPQQKPGKRCQSCPEFKRCGGGRPRCPRRSGSV